MESGAMGVSCLSCVVKHGTRAHEDAQRRRCPKASKCGSRTKGPKGVGEVPNGRHIKHRIPSIPTLHSLLLPQRCMPIIWKPSIPRCDDDVRPIAGVPTCMPRTQNDSKKGEMCTGLCITLFGYISRHVKSRQWLEGFWTMASRFMRSS